MIAAGIDAPFGNASGTFDPSMSSQQDHAQHEARKQRNIRKASRPKSAKTRNAPPHDSRLNLSPDNDMPADAQQVTKLASTC